MKVLHKRNGRAIGSNENRDDSSELLKMILIGDLSDFRKERLARKLLDQFGDLYSVIHADENALEKVPGLPQAAIKHLKQTRRLFNQIGRSSIAHRPLIDSLDRVKQFCRFTLGAKRREEFHVLFLDSSYHLLEHECLQTGTLDHVMVYPRELMHRALVNHATFLILIHNHPTSNAKPSKEDIVMTDQLHKAGAFLRIAILDHIIIGKRSEFSFRKNGLLNNQDRSQRRAIIGNLYPQEPNRRV